MWRDIALANRDALLAELAAFRAQLDRIAAHGGGRQTAPASKRMFAPRARAPAVGFPAQRRRRTVPDDGPRDR